MSEQQPSDAGDRPKREQAKRRSKRFFLILEIVTIAGVAAYYFGVLRPAEKAELEAQVGPIPAYVLADVPAPRWNGDYPCVYAEASPTGIPRIGTCTIPTPMSKASRTPVDGFETDLRTGKFILRQTDLSISGAGIEIPLTRAYTADDWLGNNPSHAFGMHSSHPYDIAPVGTRNPYTEQFIVVEDGDLFYFPRVSKGTNFSNAIFRQSEIGNSFYKAVQRWDGNGWKTELQDGSTIHFPEAYFAKNLAQGAATEMTDAAGRKIELIRDRERNLQEIRAPDGTSIKLDYDDHDRIVQASDDHGQWSKYTYDSSGFLTDVLHSNGTSRHYLYEGGLLTSVRDEQNRVLLHNEYRGKWVIRQQFGDGDAIEYNYAVAPNTFYAQRVSVKLSDGSVKVIEIGDCVSDVFKRMR